MVDIIKVVDTLDQHKLIRINRVMQEWYSIFCPFHSNGQEKKPSCGVSLHDQVRGGKLYKAGTFHCFACGISYPLEVGIDNILKSHGSVTTGKEWLSEHIPGYASEDEFDYLIPKDVSTKIDTEYALKYIQKKSGNIQKFVSEEELASYRFIVPYMYERKLTDKIIEDYDIGYDAKWIPPGRQKPVPCITIPVRDKYKRTLFLCRRSIKGKIYNYPEGVTKPVFGIDMIPSGTKSIVVCESAINALTAVSYGYPAVALLGTGNSYQIQQLKELGVQEFVLCMDGDDAGHKATNKLRNYLQSAALVWAISMPDGKDLNDCSKQEFDHLYSLRE